MLGTVRCDPWQVGRAGRRCSATPRTRSCRSTARAPTARSRTWSSWTAASTRPATTGRRRCRCSRQRRQANAEAIAQMALANFVEMRDKVASPVFQTAARRSNTRWNGPCPAGTFRGTSWSRSPPRRTPRCSAGCAGSSGCSARSAAGAVALLAGAAGRDRAEGGGDDALGSRLMAGHAPDEPGLLRNFVGGEFVDAGRRSPSVSPVTGEQIFEVAEADAVHGGRRGRRGAGGAARAVGPDGRAGARGGAAPGRRRAGTALRRPGRRRGRRHRQVHLAGAHPRHPARRGQLPGLRRHRGDRADRVVHHGHPDRRPGAELRGAQAGRRGRDHRAVEPAAAAAHLEGRAGAGLRQRGGGQAVARRPPPRRRCSPR